MLATTIAFNAAALEGAALESKMMALDAEVFDAYNHCKLERFGAFFASDVEFFHDQGGLMRSRQAVVNATKKHICGKVRRELVAGSMRVYPINKYGAIAIGEHRFCKLGGTECEGIAQFTHVWRERGGKWQLTRVLSYDHRPLK